MTTRTNDTLTISYRELDVVSGTRCLECLTRALVDMAFKTKAAVVANRSARYLGAGPRSREAYYANASQLLEARDAMERLSARIDAAAHALVRRPVVNRDPERFDHYDEEG